MKNSPSILVSVALSVLFFQSSLDVQAQGWLDKAKKVIKDVTKTTAGAPYTESDAAQAIREALSQGTSKGTERLSALNGYFGNPEIKIPFPQDAAKVESTLRKIGLSKQVDDAVESINRAAESAAIEAKPIFLKAITDMSISDAIAIVKGNNHAATDYLKKSTTNQLVEKFKPIIQAALDRVNATKYWSTVMSSYNAVPFVTKVNPDLCDYTTRKAIDGLFVMIAHEEDSIRKDPMARTSDILKKVFGI